MRKDGLPLGSGVSPGESAPGAAAISRQSAGLERVSRDTPWRRNAQGVAASLRGHARSTSM